MIQEVERKMMDKGIGTELESYDLGMIKLKKLFDTKRIPPSSVLF